MSDNTGGFRHSLNWNKIIGDTNVDIPAPDYNDLLVTIERLKSERDEAREWARRIMRERDEAKHIIALNRPAVVSMRAIKGMIEDFCMDNVSHAQCIEWVRAAVKRFTKI